MVLSVGRVKTAIYSARVHQLTKVVKDEPNGRKP
jgi:hypothetical protein